MSSKVSGQYEQKILKIYEGCFNIYVTIVAGFIQKFYIMLDLHVRDTKLKRLVLGIEYEMIML